MKSLILISILFLTGCDRYISPTEKIMSERFPDSGTVHIMIDESGNRYVVKRSTDSSGFIVLPFGFTAQPSETTISK
jgi:hypothetical protein